MMLKAVIFDMDGVLIDSEPVHSRAVILALKEYGVDLPENFIEPYIGSPPFKVFEDVIRKYQLRVSLQELIALAAQKQLEMLKAEPYVPIDGTKQLIEDLRERKILLAIASSSSEDAILRDMEMIGFREYFNVIVSGAYISHPKPAPDIFQLALQELGVSREEAVVIEDSANGVLAAKAAGIPCIGYINPHSGKQDLSKADVLVESFTGLDASYVENVRKRADNEPLTIVRTKRLEIRELRVEDVNELYRIYQDTEVCRYVTGLEETVEAEEEKMCAYIRYAYGFFGYGIWGVYDRENGQLIGRCGIQNTDIDCINEIELSYLLGREYWGYGYAWECTRAVLKYAVDQLEIDRIVAVIAHGNERSVRLAKRLGMRYEKEIMRDGQSLKVYSLESIPETLKNAAAAFQAFRENKERPDTSVYGKRYE